MVLTDGVSEWNERTQLGAGTHADKWNPATVEMSE